MPVEAGAFFTSPGQPLRQGAENLFGQGSVDHPLRAALTASPVDDQLATLLAASVRPGAGNRPEAVPGNTLFYGGDVDSQALTNEINSTVADSRVYGNFYVTDPGGWDITTVFSNNALTFNPTGGVNWEIRSGVSLNNGGTLVASGAGFPANTTVVGEFGDGLEIQVSADLTASPVHLDPGQYWLNVTPVGHGTGRSFCTETVAQANAIGAQDPGNCFWDSTTYGQNFTIADINGTPTNFSMGVGGSVTAGPVSAHPGYGLSVK
jgi:hypothetical protein